jgi:hypothetical protein
MKIQPHPIHKTMFYLKWPDNSLSDDFYNKTWVKEHRRNIQARLDSRMPLSGPEKLTGAFK